MEGSDRISEEFSDWEEIQHPFNHQPCPPSSQDQQLGFKLVITENIYHEDSSILPPTGAENFPENATSPPPLPPSFPATDSEPPEHEDFPENAPLPPPPSFPASDTDPPELKPDSKLSVLMGDIGARIHKTGKRMLVVFASRFGSHLLICSNNNRSSSSNSNNNRRCSIFVPAIALAVVILACVKILRWRNGLLLLIREKDQRISQLLHQIAHMKEMLSAPRRVPVFRIN